ncbi:hypothetical protein HYDPIDRAFT_115865 [Hydnomerulius pinastri MD-312]|uniref:phosphatidylinositol-3,4,5-trisphosphate 3-phosphatase n=1 Tax=Hydnomerulius pinastri MD-312 TaxID=994086 RepID=A0A0C9W4J8_9AGAM|nr:hypothetical protein HYDPIDRAFT_115865 [Hydnomerulius pinastri MD-312]
MSNYLRRLVSGGKARFKDDELDLELDLAYVTDQIIVMGFPATGLESIYRNRRADVQQFLSTRHGSDFWVFNLCPVTENAYDETVFQGRVSRYPFPDHHVPPLSYLPLVTREMHAWLSGSKSRVAVLHCKAGKGRSGTLACAYLLAHSISPSERLSTSSQNYEFGEWSLLSEKEGLRSAASDVSEPAELQSHIDAGTPEVATSPVSGSRVHRSLSCQAAVGPSRDTTEPSLQSVQQILKLHSSRRMKPISKRPSSTLVSSHEPKMGVSIPSQQRWLLYWSQLLAGQEPASFQIPLEGEDRPAVGQEAPLAERRARQVRLTKIIVRMRELSGVQPHLFQAANAIISRSGKGRATGQDANGKVWASLARYSDNLVEEVDRLEQSPRSQPDSEGKRATSLFKSGKWDKEKMVRRFARMGLTSVQPPQGEDPSRQIFTYTLTASSDGEWVELSNEMHKSQSEDRQNTSTLDGSAYTFVSRSTGEGEDLRGVLLEANRELRIKLFMGQVVICWAWLIPAFHISQDSPSCTVTLSRDEIDFAIGIGKALFNVEISFDVV